MSVQVFLEPGITYDWGKFVKAKPRFSIALDGIVNGPTKRIVHKNGPYVNFDHHTGADRVSTRSTSEQVHIEINLGLFQTFRHNGIPTANIFINDIDEDVCLAVWLLQNHERVVKHAEPAINRLVYCEDRLDATAGAYPFGDTAMRRKMAWIFEPYQVARFQGRLRSMKAPELMAILEAVQARITAYSLGKSHEIAMEGQFAGVGGGKGWSMVVENGPASRMAMYAAGVDAFVAYLGQRKDGNHDYAIGRRSVWIPFPVQTLFTELNKAEPNTIVQSEPENIGNASPSNGWGGSNTIGGSPRETGSTLSPARVAEVINAVLAKSDEVLA